MLKFTGNYGALPSLFSLDPMTMEWAAVGGDDGGSRDATLTIAPGVAVSRGRIYTYGGLLSGLSQQG